MSIKKSVLIFGRSLNLAGICASLKLDESLDILLIDPQATNAEQCIDEFKPDTIIFDLGDPPEYLDMALLQKQHGLLLIGVDPTNEDVLLLTGKRTRVVGSCELSQLISTHTDDKSSKSEEK